MNQENMDMMVCDEFRPNSVIPYSALQKISIAIALTIKQYKKRNNVVIEADDIIYQNENNCIS